MSEKNQKSKPKSAPKEPEIKNNNLLKFIGFSVGALVLGAGISLLGYEYFAPSLKSVAYPAQSQKETSALNTQKPLRIVDVQLSQTFVDPVASIDDTDPQKLPEMDSSNKKGLAQKELVEPQIVIQKPNFEFYKIYTLVQKIQLGFVESSDFENIKLENKNVQQALQRMKKTLEQGVLTENYVLNQLQNFKPLLEKEKDIKEPKEVSLVEGENVENKINHWVSQFVTVRKIKEKPVKEYQEDISINLVSPLLEKDWETLSGLIENSKLSNKSDLGFVERYIDQQKALSGVLQALMEIES